MKEFADQFKSIFVSYESQLPISPIRHAIPVNVSFRIARAGDPYVWKRIIVLLSNRGEMTTLCSFLNCTSNPRERFGGQSFSFE